MSFVVLVRATGVGAGQNSPFQWLKTMAANRAWATARP